MAHTGLEPAILLPQHPISGFFFFKVFLFNAMRREAEVCVCECNGHRDWERVTGPPELELQVAMNHPKCYWG